MNKAISMMKAGLKGKMSSKTVDKIVKSGDGLKKEVRQYELEFLDGTPFVGELKIGDKMSFAAMTQKRDDYCQRFGGATKGGCNHAAWHSTWVTGYAGQSSYCPTWGELASCN